MSPSLLFYYIIIPNKNKRIVVMYTKKEHFNCLKCSLEWCRRWDLNPHGVTRLILSQVRLPFRHSGIFPCRFLDTRNIIP